MKREVKNVSQVINALAEMTGRNKDESIKQICDEIKKTGQADSFDYTRFVQNGIECDCIVYLDYNKTTKTWLVEVTED